MNIVEFEEKQSKSKRVALKVDFEQVLEDLVYTNMITKTFDVRHIITKTQYYALKDSIILWICRHNIVEKGGGEVEWMEHPDWDNLWLVNIKLTYRGKEYMFHQRLDHTWKAIPWIGKEVSPVREYVPKKYDVEYDEQKFIDAIERLKITRLRFLREQENHNSFWKSVHTNKNSKNPWMRNYLSYLPENGKVNNIKIVELEK